VREADLPSRSLREVWWTVFAHPTAAPSLLTRIPPGFTYIPGTASLLRVFRSQCNLPEGPARHHLHRERVIGRPSLSTTSRVYLTGSGLRARTPGCGYDGRTCIRCRGHVGSPGTRRRFQQQLRAREDGHHGGGPWGDKTGGSRTAWSRAKRLARLESLDPHSRFILKPGADRLEVAKDWFKNLEYILRLEKSAAMILNHLEFALMNIPIRPAMQRYIECAASSCEWSVLA